MDQGAFGISTGLEYAPGQFTPTEEIVTLARLVARRDGLYATHIRNEETRLLAAINEAIEIGKRANVRLEISHLKAAGRPNWKKQQGAIHLIEAARRSGIRVFADAYPYTAYSTGITIFFDSWMLEGDHSAFLNRLKNNRDRIRKEVDSRVKRDPGAYDLIVISEVYTDKNLQLVGKNLEEISSLWNLEPVDTLLKLVEEEETRVSFIGFGMSQKNVDLVLSNPLVMIGSDGYSMAPTGEAAKTKPHPRSYGAFARILSFYVREKKLFDLPTAVKKMTCMAADQVGIRDRGRIAKGMKADILIFNDEKIRDNASFGDPHQYSTGIEYVMVNGKMVVDKGKHTGKRAGAILRKMLNFNHK